jgi:serine protease Do
VRKPFLNYQDRALQKHSLFIFLSLLIIAYVNPSFAHNIVSVVAQVKPSIVGVGTYNPLTAPRNVLKGTGFVIGDGSLVATNFHVVDGKMDKSKSQSWVIFAGTGRQPKVIKVELVASDETHDLAILKMSEKLPAIKLAGNEFVSDGTDVGFTGYPIGAILGLYPVTHRGMIAALTPVAVPVVDTKQLTIAMRKRLRDPFYVYQMDATAYPGNSGSPVYNLHNGDVVAIINKVFVKKTKEAVLSDPSGITYAIPVKYLDDLINSL